MDVIAIPVNTGETRALIRLKDPGSARSFQGKAANTGWQPTPQIK